MHFCSPAWPLVPDCVSLISDLVILAPRGMNRPNPVYSQKRALLRIAQRVLKYCSPHDCNEISHSPKAKTVLKINEIHKEVLPWQPCPLNRFAGYQTAG